MPFEPILALEGIVKQFGDVVALDAVDFEVHEGEIVALVGDNGSGKSTLAGVLSGEIQPDSGVVRHLGARVTLDCLDKARELGIETMYQDLALSPDLGSAQNLFLGRETRCDGLRGALGMLNHRDMAETTERALRRLGTTIEDVNVPSSGLSGGQRQAVALVRATHFARHIVILDDPTAALSVVARGRVLDMIHRLRDTGVAVVLISHNLAEVLDVADRVDVLRHGRRVGSMRRGRTSTEHLIGLMTGTLVAG